MQSFKWMSQSSWAGGSGRVELKIVPSLPLLPCESLVSVKENPDRQKNVESLFYAVL